MISEASFITLQTMRRAAVDGHLALLSSRLIATGEPIAMVAAIVRQPDGATVVTPLGMLPALMPGNADLVGPGGALLPRAGRRFNEVHKLLLSDTHQAWLKLDTAQRPIVCFSDGGKGLRRWLLVLPWDDPYRLFAAPVGSDLDAG